jgi:3-methyladenine DNA glycosylase/8-oxoguanine DNA glycosylase
MKKQLAASTPFDFWGVVESHGWADLAPFSKVEQEGALVYTACLDGERVVAIKMKGAENGVYVETETMRADHTARIEAMVTWMLGMDQSFEAFYGLAGGHPKLAQACKRGAGRFLRSPSLFEDTVKTILTTNTSWAGTIRMVDALVRDYGQPSPHNPEHQAFPEPVRLADVDEAELAETARLGYRTPYILELARDVASGTRDLERLKSSNLPTAEIKQELLSIKGVGDYSAASLLMLLGRYDSIPIDSWAYKLVSYEWHDGEPVGRQEVEEAVETWGRWKGLAYWFWDWEYLKQN